MTPLQHHDGTLAFDNDIDAVLNDLRTALNGAMEFVKADKYANIPDVSTDMLVAVLSTAYDSIVD